MPKRRTTKETILDAALEMTRERGFESLNARSVAEFMGRSVQPIYSYFRNMEELKDALYQRAMGYYDDFIRRNADMLSLRSMGTANIRFARREPNLFHMLFLAKLEGFHSVSDLFGKMGRGAAADKVAGDFGIGAPAAREIYIMMIVFTHGIAAMLATGSADLPDDEIDELIGEAFASFVGRQIEKMSI